MTTTVNAVSDSDGTAYEVCKQSKDNTCGPASMFMYECMVRQTSMKGGEDRIIKISNYFDGNAASDAAGTDSENVLQTLQHIGARVREIDEPGEDFLGLPKFTRIKPGRIAVDRPALVLLGWYDKYLHVKRKGGHYVVAARFTSGGKVAFLDPGLGQVVECVNNARYNPRNGGNGCIEMVVYSG